MKIGRLVVSPVDAAKLRLTDWYSYHRLMTEVFKKAGPCELLWHFCGRSDEGLAFVLLTNGRPTIPSYTDLDLMLRDFGDSFLSQKRYRFEVRMCMNRMPRDGRRKKAFLNEEDVIPKFIGRSADWGFRPETLRLEDFRVQTFRHREGLMSIPMYDISGILQVTDPAVFRRAALSGIGAKLSFGCGLLRLYPMPEGE